MRFECVVRVESIEQDSTMSLWMSFARGYNLGIPYERYLWRVYVRQEGPRVECLCGMKARDGGAIEAWGVGWPLRGDVLFGHPKDLYVLGTGS